MDDIKSLDAWAQMQRYLRHDVNCHITNQFMRKRPACSRCHGTGYIPSEDCDECVDCQDACPICGNEPSIPAPCSCGLEAVASLLSQSRTHLEEKDNRIKDLERQLRQYGQEGIDWD